jgi:putative NADH-flavin reductase
MMHNLSSSLDRSASSQGDIYDHESLVAAFKQADVVISAVGHHGPHDLEDGQLRIVAAIKEAGNVKVHTHAY